MEIKVNKEIRRYTEKVFFGLSLRETICVGMALAASVAIYFPASAVMPLELVTWLCIAGASPFAFMGFFKYHDMPAERALWIILKNKGLTPKILTYKSHSDPYLLANRSRKERRKHGNQNDKKHLHAAKQKRKGGQKKGRQNHPAGNPDQKSV